MKSDQLARWLNLTANIGVLIGIALVIVELDQNRDMMRAQTRHELSMGIVDLLQTPANNAQLADVIYRGENGLELTPEEELQFVMRTNALLRYWEDVHYQYRVGLYDDSEFEVQREAWREAFQRSQGMLDYWCRVRRLYSPAYAREVDALLPAGAC
jgi:hypothetical protein